MTSLHCLFNTFILIMSIHTNVFVSIHAEITNYSYKNGLCGIRKNEQSILVRMDRYFRVSGYLHLRVIETRAPRDTDRSPEYNELLLSARLPPPPLTYFCKPGSAPKADMAKTSYCKFKTISTNFINIYKQICRKGWLCVPIHIHA